MAKASGASATQPSRGLLRDTRIHTRGIRMNTLNHMNLSTSDVTALAEFFHRVFDFRLVDERGAGNFAIMTSEDGFVLTLMKDKTLQEQGYPGTFHVGFLQPDQSSVQDLYARIQAIGLPVPSPGPMRANTFGFYVQAPGGIVVEVSSCA
jgi:catechol-2,3-dioxygenase